MHQCAPVNSVKTRASALSKPDREADFTRQTVEEGKALALPVVRAKEGLHELLFEGVRVGQVKSTKLATFRIYQDEAQCCQYHLSFAFKCAHSFNI